MKRVSIKKECLKAGQKSNLAWNGPFQPVVVHCQQVHAAPGSKFTWNVSIKRILIKIDLGHSAALPELSRDFTMHHVAIEPKGGQPAVVA